MSIEESMHVKFEESTLFVKNIIETQIEIASKELEKISLKDTFAVEVDQEANWSIRTIRWSPTTT